MQEWSPQVLWYTLSYVEYQIHRNILSNIVLLEGVPIEVYEGVQLDDSNYIPFVYLPNHNFTHWMIDIYV